MGADKGREHSPYLAVYHGEHGESWPPSERASRGASRERPGTRTIGATTSHIGEMSKRWQENRHLGLILALRTR